MLGSKLTRALVLSLAISTITLVAPQLTTPASAGAVVSSFNYGDIVKVKTIWGGGWVLNIGDNNGSQTAGTPAKVHWNFSWDHSNRFYVDVGKFQNGFWWHRLVNRRSGMCLAVKQIFHGKAVTQEQCDNSDNQQWAGEWWPGYSTVWIRNLAYHKSTSTAILSQYETAVGSPIQMLDFVNDPYRQEWELHSCLFNGAEQKDC